MSEPETEQPSEDPTETTEAVAHRQNYCYVLWNGEGGKTYNGYTNDLARRLRQHNGELKGGARCTTRAVASGDRPWQYLAIVRVEGITKREALSLEWHIRYPTCRRPRPSSFRGADGRLRSVVLALAWFLKERKTGAATTLFVHSSFLSRARELLAEEEVTRTVAVAGLEPFPSPL